MNVAIISSIKDERTKSEVDEIIVYLKNSNISKKYKIKYVTRITSSVNVDIGIIFSNDIKDIKEIIKKYKSKNFKSIIVTKNLEENHVLECINITPFVSYIKSENNVMLERLEDVIKKYNIGKC